MRQRKPTPMELALDAALRPLSHQQPKPATGQTDTAELQPGSLSSQFSADDVLWMQRLGIRSE